MDWSRRHAFVVTLTLALAVVALAAGSPAVASCVEDKHCSFPYGDGNCPTLGCCGGDGQRQCCTGCIGSDAPSACAPGLEHNEADGLCHLPCVQRNHCTFPYGDGNCPTLGCCGGDGERFCLVGPGSDAPSQCAPGLVAEADFKCHQPCAVRNHCSFPYGDGNCPTLGCCGGEGQRQCCTGCIGSEAPSACAPGLVAAITCQRPRTIGEACGPDAPCKDGLQCGIFSLKCENNAGDELYTREECLALYSQDLADAARNANTTMSYGLQAVLSAGASGSYEVGTVYGQNGKFGCYLTYCIGGDTNLAIGADFCLGLTDTWDHFEGSSFVISESAGEVVNFTTSQGFDDASCAFSTPSCLTSTADCLGVSLDLLPVSVGAYYCNTIVRTVVGDDPPKARCKNVDQCADAACNAAAISIDDGSYDPNDDTITKSQSPAGPYAVGSRQVTLSVTDSGNNVDACTGTVSVRDCTPPSIQCAAPAIVECQSNRQAVVTVAPPTAADTCGPATVSVPGPASYPLGTTTVTEGAVDGSDNTASCTTSVTVQDTIGPVVTIGAPASGLCTNQPVTVVSSTTEACDPSPSVTMMPAGGPTYTAHGDYGVVVQATDQSGNLGGASVGFTIDLVPPTVTLLNKDRLALTPGAPFTVLFTDADDDKAQGGVTWERVLLDRCVLFDGKTFGNRDGLLRDETLSVSAADLCRLATECNVSTLTNPVLSVEAYDCGGNRSADTKTLRGTLRLRPGLCGR